MAKLEPQIRDVDLGVEDFGLLEKIGALDGDQTGRVLTVLVQTARDQKIPLCEVLERYEVLRHGHDMASALRALA